MAVRERKRILVLGGTSEARRAAAVLDAAGFAVVTSLAGVTKTPLLPVGDVRSGGFGGVAGLAKYINEAKIVAVVDATHPFAENITRHGFEAATLCKVPHVWLERRPWKPLDGEKWHVVANVEEAARAVPPGGRVFLTIGRRGLDAFMARDDLSVLVRSIEAPDFEPPENWKFITERPPFALEAEKQLMENFAINTLVSKNSGGKAVAAKLAAARSLGIKVIMIERPHIPGIRKVRTTDQMLKYLPRA